jgi:hypothetical protein
VSVSVVRSVIVVGETVTEVVVSVSVVEYVVE